jgi:hypothetical protein
MFFIEILRTSRSLSCGDPGALSITIQAAGARVKKPGQSVLAAVSEKG